MQFTLVGLRPNGSLVKYPKPLTRSTGSEVDAVVNAFRQEHDCGPTCLVDDKLAAERRISPMTFAMRFFQNIMRVQTS